MWRAALQVCLETEEHLEIASASFCISLYVVFEVSKVLPLIVMIGRRSMLSGSESTNAYLLVGWKGSPGTDVTKMF